MVSNRDIRTLLESAFSTRLSLSVMTELMTTIVTRHNLLYLLLI